jgi:hypothetical protein
MNPRAKIAIEQGLMMTCDFDSITGLDWANIPQILKVIPNIVPMTEKNFTRREGKFTPIVSVTKLEKQIWIGHSMEPCANPRTSTTSYFVREDKFQGYRDQSAYRNLLDKSIAVKCMSCVANLLELANQFQEGRKMADLTFSEHSVLISTYDRATMIFPNMEVERHLPIDLPILRIFRTSFPTDKEGVDHLITRYRSKTLITQLNRNLTHKNCPILF